MENKVSINKYLINLCFFLYFIILIVERVISITQSFINGVNIFDSYFNGFVYLLTFISLGATIILLIFNRYHFVGLFSRDEKVYSKIDFIKLSIISGVILFSGMVHTEYSSFLIQVVSYAFLIIGILFKVIDINKNSKNRYNLWLSFIYLVCFAMAIPVMYSYPSSTNVNALYALETITVLLLVPAYTYFMIRLFRNEENKIFNPLLFILLIALDSSILVLRWNHESTTFVLIFLIATIVTYIVFFAPKLFSNKRSE